jgi:hypothetical protein
MKIYPTNIIYHTIFVNITLKVRCITRDHKEVIGCCVRSIFRAPCGIRLMLISINNVQIVIIPGTNERIFR